MKTLVYSFALVAFVVAINTICIQQVHAESIWLQTATNVPKFSLTVPSYIPKPETIVIDPHYKSFQIRRGVTVIPCRWFFRRVNNRDEKAEDKLRLSSPDGVRNLFSTITTCLDQYSGTNKERARNCCRYLSSALNCVCGPDQLQIPGPTDSALRRCNIDASTGNVGKSCPRENSCDNGGLSADEISNLFQRTEECISIGKSDESSTKGCCDHLRDGLNCVCRASKQLVRNIPFSIAISHCKIDAAKDFGKSCGNGWLT